MGSGLFQSRVPASTAYERDPRCLPKFALIANALSAGADNANSAAFWTAVDNIGDFQSSDPFTAQRTIVSVSGRGVFLGAIGNSLNNGVGGTTTWTITIDGAVYTIVHNMGMAAGGPRSVLGDILISSAAYTTAANSGGYAASTDLTARADNGSTYFTGVASQLKSPHLCSRFIKFDVSLSVKIATSIAAADARCGAIWWLE